LERVKTATMGGRSDWHDQWGKSLGPCKRKIELWESREKRVGEKGKKTLFRDRGGAEDCLSQLTALKEMTHSGEGSQGVTGLSWPQRRGSGQKHTKWSPCRGLDKGQDQGRAKTVSPENKTTPPKTKTGLG